MFDDNKLMYLSF